MDNEEFVKHQSEMARGVVEIKDGATRDAFGDIRRQCRVRLKEVESKHAKIIKEAGLALAQAYADEAADSNDLNRLSDTLKNMMAKYNVEERAIKAKAEKLEQQKKRTQANIKKHAEKTEGE